MYYIESGFLQICITLQYNVLKKSWYKKCFFLFFIQFSPFSSKFKRMILHNVWSGLLFSFFICGFKLFCSDHSYRNVAWNNFYHLLLILTALLMLHDKHCLSHSMCLYQVMISLHFLNDVANDTESTQKLKITS